MKDLGYVVGTNLPIATVQSSTAVSVAVTELITGAAPSQGEFIARANFAQQQFSYYATVLHVANPQLGPYEALGKSFGETAQFAAKYGPSVDATTTAFIQHAYQDVFLSAAPSASVQNFEGQISFYVNLFQSSGSPAGSATLQARGAVVGQMIAYAMTDPAISARPAVTLDDQVASFLAKAEAGNASFGAAITPSAISETPLIGVLAISYESSIFA